MAAHSSEPVSPRRGPARARTRWDKGGPDHADDPGTKLVGDRPPRVFAV